MKPSLIVGLFCLVAAASVVPVALAAPETPEAAPLQVQDERARIQRLRSQAEAVAQQANVDCYQKFAVTDCLRAARAKKRLILDDLRRQEVILNDLERKNKAIEALNKIQEKSAGGAKEPDARP